jgi:(2Fe-2S) ferredoxin
LNSPTYRAYICCGPNCGPKGSGSLLDFLAGEIDRRGLAERVSVLSTGCQSHCESGPTMVVYPGPVFYQGVDRARLLRIIAEHFLAGRPVTDYFWEAPGRGGRTEQKKPLIDAPPGTATSPEPRFKPPKRRPAPEVDDFKW